MTILGMVQWEVRRTAISAIAVNPGVFATVSKFGASPFGDGRRPFSMV
jgi:hypothetical protein